MSISQLFTPNDYDLYCNQITPTINNNIGPTGPTGATGIDGATGPTGSPVLTYVRTWNGQTGDISPTTDDIATIGLTGSFVTYAGSPVNQTLLNNYIQNYCPLPTCQGYSSLVVPDSTFTTVPITSLSATNVPGQYVVTSDSIQDMTIVSAITGTSFVMCSGFVEFISLPSGTLFGARILQDGSEWARQISIMDSDSSTALFNFCFIRLGNSESIYTLQAYQQSGADQSLELGFLSLTVIGPV